MPLRHILENRKYSSNNAIFYRQTNCFVSFGDRYGHGESPAPDANISGSRTRSDDEGHDNPLDVFVIS